jgi:cytochrome c peroxidase
MAPGVLNLLLCQLNREEQGRRYFRWVGRMAVVLLLVCVSCKGPISSKPIGVEVAIHPPLGLPPVPTPKDNWPTADSIALGRRLFYETRLSKDNSLSCSSCHRPQSGFRDNRELSLGVGGTKGERHAPTLVNVAYAPLLFWDGRVLTLEDQVGSPIANVLEVNQTHAASVDKLRDDPVYKRMFLAAFGSEDVTMKRMENALASFERTILSGNSAFDRHQYEGKKDALTPAQVRGLTVFLDPERGNCAACHTVTAKDALFTDGKFHNTGEGAGDVEEFADPGRFVVTKVEAERGAFKTPTLRNVALSGPYMHDGKLKTLKEVVDFYAGRGNSNVNLDKRVAAIVLNGRDRSDLVEFLKALTGDMPANVGSPDTK